MFEVINYILEFRTLQNMKGDDVCGYYSILSQLYPNKYGEYILAPGSNNEKVRSINVNKLKIKIMVNNLIIY
jgi:hypothetical protein